MKKSIFFILMLGFLPFIELSAQLENEELQQIELDGEIVTVLITDDNDTLLVADLEDVGITSPRRFKDKKEYRRYLKYRRYANVVYPYALKAIQIFEEADEVTRSMKKGKRKKHIRKLQKQLKKEFEDPLRQLTKTQGLILIKMIENELDTPMYNLIKNLRGTVVASYWNTIAKVNGYRLKEKYTPGEDPILDTVIEDFTISMHRE